jgi:hypothetical protein
MQMQNQNAMSSCMSRIGAENPPPFGTRLVLVSTVDVAAEPVCTGDDTVLADGALSQGPADGAAVVADTEGVRADTNESTILGARCARRGAVALGVGGARRVAGGRRDCCGRRSDRLLLCAGQSCKSGLSLTSLLVVVGCGDPR